MTRSSDDVTIGVLCALGVVYTAGEETLAEEILTACDGRECLRVAVENEDIFAPNIRNTLAFLAERRTALRAHAARRSV